MLAKILVLSAVALSAAVAPSQAALLDVGNIWGLGFGDSPFGAEAQAQQLSRSFNSKPDSGSPPLDLSAGDSEANISEGFPSGSALALADGVALEGRAEADTLAETTAPFFAGDAFSRAESVAESDDVSLSFAEADSKTFAGDFSAFSEADAFASSSGDFAGSFSKADAAGTINAGAAAYSVTEPYNTLKAGGAYSEANAAAKFSEALALADSQAVADEKAVSTAEANSASQFSGSATAVASAVSEANDNAEADAEAEAVSLGGDTRFSNSATAVASAVSEANDNAEADAEAEAVSLGGDGADSSALAVASGSGVEELGMELGGALLCPTFGRKLLCP